MKKRIILMSALVAAQFPMSADYSQALNGRADYTQAINLTKNKAFKISTALQEKIVKLAEENPYSAFALLAAVIGCIVYKCLVDIPAQKNGIAAATINAQKNLLKFSLVGIQDAPYNISICKPKQQNGSTPVAVQAQPETTVVEADPMNYLHNELEWPGKNEITYFE